MYIPPRGPKPEDMKWIASRIACYIKSRLEKGNLKEVTTEIIIEEFRNMCDDYDDWWGRGLTNKETEYKFVKTLLADLEEYGITNVRDNTYTI